MPILTSTEYDTLADAGGPVSHARIFHTDNGHAVLTGTPAHPGDDPADFLLVDLGTMLSVSTIGFATMALHPEHARALADYLTEWADRTEAGR